MIFDDSVNENKVLLKKSADVWDGIKSEIKAIITEKITWKLNLILTMTSH